MTAELTVPEADHTASSASTLAGDRASIPEKQADSGDETAKSEIGAEMSDDEYPKGVKMVFIVVALVLGIFLIALDMVSAFLHRLCSGCTC